MITPLETRPFATCVPVVNSMTPSSVIRLATIQIWAAAAHFKVEGVLHEETIAVCGAVLCDTPAT
jgi:hypothetical protein